MNDQTAPTPDLSPFRYPGGKGWFVPQLLAWIRSLPFRPQLFVEPFAGGASAALAVAASDLVQRVMMIEKDCEVAAVWHCLLGPGHDRLIERVRALPSTDEGIRAALAAPGAAPVDTAFRLLLRNRVARDRYLHADAPLRIRYVKRSGAVHWHPETLARQIERIARLAPRIEFLKGDAVPVLPRLLAEENNVLFLDPPYSVGVVPSHRRYYRHAALDYQRLFQLLGGARAPFLMFCDDLPQLRALAETNGLMVNDARRRGGNRVHELLVTRREYPLPESTP